MVYPRQLFLGVGSAYGTMLSKRTSHADSERRGYRSARPCRNSRILLENERMKFFNTWEL